MKGGIYLLRLIRLVIFVLVLLTCIRPFRPRFFPKISTCADPFYVRVPHTLNTPHTPSLWPCVVKPPLNYTPPLPRPRSLWRTPLANVGELDTSNSEYRLHLANQRWARLERHEINIREEGGTSGRSFANNFEYVKFLIQKLKPIRRCAPNAPYVMLDMGAGIGSVAAALADERGGDGAIKALSYVWPDDYLRLQTIISDRGLPSFLANFTGSLPFPSSSFDIVHCKWCWHHNAGYDVWLKEVNRLLVPGGFFIFTFAPEATELLKHPAWEKALARQPFKCKRVHRIITMCQKNRTLDKKNSDGDRFRKADYCPRDVKRSIMRSNKELKDGLQHAEQDLVLVAESVKALTKDSTVRLLSVNCPHAQLCVGLDSVPNSSVLHVNHASQKQVVKGILSLGGLAMLQNWKNNVPVYPRSFDVIHLGCNPRSKHLLERPEFWLELHRVLRPGGIVTLAKSFCRWYFKKTFSPLGFKTKKISKHFFVANRLEMFN
ncbi:unnamed protein product [Agarophyton chilense]